MQGQNQPPFNGTLDYDYLMWIDSDILFTPEQFERLLHRDRDIIAGLYRMEGGDSYAAVENWDENYFERNGTFRFLAPTDIKGMKEPIPVSYIGMGFMLVKKGVFEKMEYPWFRPLKKNIGHLVDFTMEDTSFCLQARERGFEVLADPTVILGHEKTVVL